jgi:hypothetical protein
MRKNIIYGHLTILAAMTFAVLGTFLYDWLCTITIHSLRLGIIFTIGGAVMAIASIFTAAYYYTNNMGEGFKN